MDFIMARMTDEEAQRLDEKWTKNPPKPGPNGTGYFTQCKKTAHTITIDSVTAGERMKKLVLLGLFLVILSGNIFAQQRPENQWLTGRWVSEEFTLGLHDNGTGSWIEAGETYALFFSVGPGNALEPGSNASIIMFFVGERLENAEVFMIFRINDQRMVMLCLIDEEWIEFRR